MEILKQFIFFSLFLQISSGTLFSLPNSCVKETNDQTLENQTLSKCTNLLEDSNHHIHNHLTMLYSIYDLKYSQIILIVSSNIRDAISLGRFLSSNNLKQRKKNRQNISNDQLATYDFILNNIHLYENPSKNQTIFVYPQETGDNDLAEILALHIVKAAKSMKIILTTNILSGGNKNNILGTFKIAAKFLRYPRSYEYSITYFLTVNDKSKGQFDSSSNDVLKTPRITKQEFIEIIQNYLKIFQENEKILVKFILNRERNIIFTDFTKIEYEKIFQHLNTLGQATVNHYDFQNVQILHLDCLNNLANDQLTIALNSLKSTLILNLQDKTNQSRTLTGIFAKSTKLNQTFGSLTEFFECTKSTNVEPLKQCFEKLSKDFQQIEIGTKDIASANYYLSLFCEVQQASFITLPEVEYLLDSSKWTEDLRNFHTTILRRTNDWYRKLISIYNGVQEVSEEDTNRDLKNQLNNLKEDPITFHDVNTAKIAHETIKTNSVRMMANYTYQRIDSEMKLQVKGKFLLLSKIMSSNWFRKSFKILEIFALEKIIIDEDLIGRVDGLDVFIFAPIWEIVDSRQITLDGIPGEQIRGNLNPKARNGNQVTNPNGLNGKAGVSGGAAGTFFGFAETIINAQNLKISLNGGNGSDGQDGGDAANGDDGETPSTYFIQENLNRHRCSWPVSNPFIYQIGKPEGEKYYVPLIGTLIPLKYKQECYIFGLDGYPGGHGGQGGVSGKGGKAGIYKLYPFDDSTTFGVNLSLANGTDGKGGLGGSAGKGGHTWKVTFHNYNYFDYSVTKNETYNRAMDGNEGSGNSSIIGLKLIPHRPILQTYGQTANLYKRYILSEIGQNGNKFMKLYKKVINNEHILKEYDTLTLVDELIDLEQHYYKMDNKTTTLYLYQSWKKRLIHYSKNRKTNEMSDEYSEVLRTLQSTVTKKVKRLFQNSQNFLIFKLADYLQETQQQVQHLHNAKTVVVIKNMNKKYTDEYDDKIEEAQRIIQDDLQMNLTQHNEELSGEMEILLRRIAQLANIEAQRAAELVRRSSSMQEKAIIKTFNEIFTILNTALGIINPALATIGTKISAAGSIVQNFLDDTMDTNIDIMIPNMVDKSKKFFNNWIDMKREFQRLTIDENLEIVEKNRRQLVSKGKNVEPLEKIEKTFKDLKTQMNDKSFDVIANLNQQLETESSAWQQKNKNPKKTFTESLKVINHLKTYTRLKQMLGDVLSKCQDLKNPKKIDGISDQIEKAFIKTRELRNFKEEVLEGMLPLLMKIHEHTTAENFHSSSVAFLDFKKFQMEQYFQNVFQQIDYFAREFKLSSYFDKTLKKMQTVVNMIIGTYTRIEEYVQTMKNANYETDLYLSPFDITYVKDPKLSISLAKMIQQSFANIVLDDYTKWMASFNQYIFPFADEFLGVYDSSIPAVDDLIVRAQDAGERLEIYGSKINKKRAELREFENTVSTIFGYSLPPFHTWCTSEYQNEINKFLSGRKITLHANITEHKNLNSVKFSDIWIRLSSNNNVDDKEMNRQLKNDLKGFAFTLEHHGDSHYRCDERIFLINSKRHRAEKIFNDEKLEYYDDNNNLILKMIPAEKIKNDYILSPYATWSLQIISRDVDKNYTNLEKYKTKINIELVGFGQYSDLNLSVCQTDLRKYYKNEL
ncbi:uncharacterized protein LOC122506613 [Leptopilina heterotoma]|uniref:uncharacterized protein LOC122506613 n=1 Tax=Leptopilina heterotoma TaxID=63436 RepID=UPI001CA7D8A1|nr:uncharacterized protein LOC122506613 [Leptopilina heterotoma]